MRNAQIDIFRLFLILWIILFHFTTGYNGLIGVNPIHFPLSFSLGGTVGTTIFFILAGWYMGKSITGLSFTSIQDYIKFATKRYWRLWPSYAVAVSLIFVFLLLVPLPNVKNTVFEWCINFLLIVHPGINYIDGAHWFLSALFVSQLITALTIFAPPILRKWIIFILLLILSIVFYRWEYEPSFLFIYLSSWMRVLLGVVVYIAVKCEGWFHSRYVNISLVLLLTVIIFYSEGLRSFFLALIITYGIMLILLSLRINGSSHFCELATKVSEFSFVWYLVHQRIGYTLLHHFCPSGELSAVWLLFPILVTALLALVVYYLSQNLVSYIKNKHCFN